MSVWKEWKKSQVKPWAMLNPRTQWCSEEESDRRYEICRGCPELIDLTKQCKQCGCVMPVKSKMQAATCPLGKW